MRTRAKAEQSAEDIHSMRTKTMEYQKALHMLQQHNGQSLQSRCNRHTVPALPERADMVVMCTSKQDLPCYHSRSASSKRLMPGVEQTEQSSSPKARRPALRKAAQESILSPHDSFVNNSAISAVCAADLQLHLHCQAAPDVKHVHGMSPTSTVCDLNWSSDSLSTSILGLFGTILLVTIVAWVWMLLWTNASRVWALQSCIRTLQARLAMFHLRRPQAVQDRLPRRPSMQSHGSRTFVYHMSMSVRQHEHRRSTGNTTYVIEGGSIVCRKQNQSQGI
ncbi:hypothetical protein ABBQ38_008505 [Trebouxia sp. C0009 RCD-2024]